MKFVLLFGPQAVGKMTVGQELERLTGLKLFHNHMTIDLVAPFFSYGSARASGWWRCSAGRSLRPWPRATCPG